MGWPVAFLRKGVALAFPFLSASAIAQSLAVMPISVALPPGQKATTLTVINKGQTATSVQIRIYGWTQAGGEDRLIASELVMASPPIATIQPNASQTIRLVLRRSPENQEETYRIILDQIPPPPEPGVVHVVLRMSIPLFAETKGLLSPQLRFHLEREGTDIFLVCANDGESHETLRDMQLTLDNGTKVQVDSLGSPYILAGMTRRWHLAAGSTLPVDGMLRITAQGVTTTIHQQVQTGATP